jgi:hypothetical protein
VILRNFIYKIAEFTLGSSAVQSILAQEGKISLKRYYKTLLRKKMLFGEFKESKAQLKSLGEVCWANVSPVTAPLALISQVQRSGGSLLSQLFDGHPELHAHPHELKIGYPKKHMWPTIDLNEHPQRWLEILFEDKVIHHFKDGYKKERKQDEAFPFIFMPFVQSRVFLDYLNSVESKTLRDVFDAYMTSYFGAWLNNQNTSGNKKFITAFTARLAMSIDNMESFFEIYPDGRLISIVRDPKNWFPSAVRHDPVKYGDIKSALGLWNESTQAMIRNKEKFGERVCVVKFEDLVSRTELVMRHLAHFLDIQFDEILLTPTFNKSSIRANTSFEMEQTGILNSTLTRYKTLRDDELEIIDKMTKEEYQKVLDNIVEF